MIFDQDYNKVHVGLRRIQADVFFWGAEFQHNEWYEIECSHH